MTREAVESIDGGGVSRLAEITHAGEDTGGGREREIELLELDGDFSGEDGAGRCAVNCDVIRLISLE